MDNLTSGRPLVNMLGFRGRVRALVMGTTSQSVSFVRARSDIRSFRTTGAPRKTIYLNGESKVINCPITDVGGTNYLCISNTLPP